MVHNHKMGMPHTPGHVTNIINRIFRNLPKEEAAASSSSVLEHAIIRKLRSSQEEKREGDRGSRLQG